MSVSVGTKVRIRKNGAALTTTGEAFTLVTGKQYKVTDRSKIRFDLTATLTVYDDGTPVASSNYNVQPLTGQVIFISTYTITGAITADYSYFPSTIIGFAKSGEYGETTDLEDATTFKTAKDDIDAGGVPSRRNETLLTAASGSIGGFYDLSENFTNDLANGLEVILEFQSDYTDNTDIIYVKTFLESDNTTFNVEELNKYEINWQSNGAIEYEPS